MNEYRYLRLCVMWKYQSQVESIITPIHDLYKEALLKGDTELACFLEFKRDLYHQKLYSDRLRSEDIIHWLKLDAELREIGETYPSAMEGKCN